VGSLVGKMKVVLSKQKGFMKTLGRISPTLVSFFFKMEILWKRKDGIYDFGRKNGFDKTTHGSL
jgi:hypothetical protein